MQSTRAKPRHPADLVFDAEGTARLLPYSDLVQQLRRAAIELGSGSIVSPERTVLRLPSGASLLSMPAASDDLAIHKLVHAQPADKARNMGRVISGQVAAYDGTSGEFICSLDGPTVTMRRTAAMTLLAVETFRRHPPKRVLLIGTGRQARGHLDALHALAPECEILVRGSSERSAVEFCDASRALHSRLSADGPGSASTGEVDVVIAVTTSTSPIYDAAPTASRLVIGVGAYQPSMAEIGPVTLAGSQIYVDDLLGAKHEAGDLLQANVDWAGVRPIAHAFEHPADLTRPIVVKTVGTGAWDLAACRVARANLKGQL